MKVELSLQELEYVIAVLATRPYNEVAPLIQGLQAQAAEAVGAPSEPGAPEA